MSSFSERIRTARGKMSRSEFSKKTGISERALVNYEHGLTLPNVDVAAKICIECNISPQWLLLGQGAMGTGADMGGKESANVIYLDPAVQLVVEAAKEVGILLNKEQQEAVVTIVRGELQKQAKNILQAIKGA